MQKSFSFLFTSHLQEWNKATPKNKCNLNFKAIATHLWEAQGC